MLLHAIINNDSPVYLSERFVFIPWISSYSTKTRWLSTICTYLPHIKVQQSIYSFCGTLQEQTPWHVRKNKLITALDSGVEVKSHLRALVDWGLIEFRIDGVKANQTHNT